MGTEPTFYYDPDVADEEWGPSIVFTHECVPDTNARAITQHLPVDVPSKWDELRQGHHPVWHLAQIEPFTITPSILCHMCGTHGFITEGRWIPA